MALVGLPLGAAAGLLLAWVISLCLLPLIGHAVPFDLRLPLLAACSATALLIVLAASWLPARAPPVPPPSEPSTPSKRPLPAATCVLRCAAVCLAFPNSPGVG